MPRNSLKSLLNRFPYFLDKSSVSNFYKSQDVTNKLFQDVYNSLFKVYESFHLHKRCLIWKEQSREYDYTVNFAVNFPNLKSVKCYKNDSLIYMEEYLEDENKHDFFYSYNVEYVNENITSLKVFKCSECGHLYLSKEMPAECKICDNTSFEILQTFMCVDCGEIFFDVTPPDTCPTCGGDTYIEIQPYKCVNCGTVYLKENPPDVCEVCGFDRFLETNHLTINESESIVSYDNSILSDDENVTLNLPIIPEDYFRVEVETYDEYFLEKGFPENDEVLGNIYDHDYSLDEIGALHNIPRKNYIVVDEVDYPKTEPPFNNRLSEDDYHYMNRIINYVLHLHDTPLPVLEIWKLYGLDAVMLNRERLLLKFFDETKHEFDEETGHVMDWVPEVWEHKDGFYDESKSLGEYFFVIPSTNFPKKGNGLSFDFKWVNGLNESLDIDYTITIYLNDEELVIDGVMQNYYVSPDKLDNDVPVNVFKFICKDLEGNVIAEESVNVTVQGCFNADYYVNRNGDDDNLGTIESPFRTVDKALSKISKNKNLIVVQGEVELTNTTLVNETCTILGCGNGCIVHDNTNKFFNLIGNKNITLSLLDCTLKSNNAIVNFTSENFTNYNKKYNDYLTVLVNGGTPLLTAETDKDSYYYQYDNISLQGKLLTKENNPLSNQPITIYYGDELIKTINTTNTGEFKTIIPITESEACRKTIKIIYEGSSTFLDNKVELTLDLSKAAEKITISSNRQVTLTSENNTPGQTVKFYYQNSLLGTVTADNEGIATFNYTLTSDEMLIYTSDDGLNVEEAFLVVVSSKIQDLEATEFVTDFEILENGDMYVTKTPLSEFEKLSDFENVILNITVNNDNKLVITKFESAYSDSSILNGDEILNADMEILTQALVDLTFENGLLKGKRWEE